MPVNISGSGSITGLSVGGLEDGIITPSELSTGGPSWDATGNLQVNAINAGPLAGFRNAIINGNFSVWQRGTSFGSLVNAQYHADRWRVVYGGGGTRTLSFQSFDPGQTDVPGNPASYLKWNQTVAGSGQTAHDLRQAIEDVRTFSGSQVTVSFYAKAAANTTLPELFLVQNFGSGGSTAVNNSIASNVALTTSWQRVVATTVLPSISGKTIGSSHFLDLVIRMPLNATFNIDIAQVQVEAGPVATPFESRPVALERILCQRYYIVMGGTGLASQFSGDVTSGAAYQSVTFFPVEMRITPNVTLTNQANVAFSATVGTASAGRYSVQEQRTANGTGRGAFLSQVEADAEF